MSASICMSISVDPKPPKYESKDIVKSGDFTALRKEDGLAIISYNGEAETVVIPETILGIPVIALGDNVYKPFPFSPYIFNQNETMKTIHIPASIEMIEQQAFVACYPEAIHVSEANQNYASVDGVLFDKEKKCLLRYPIDKKDASYQVPDGVLVINEHAFYGCLPKQIALPTSLERIESEAFHECHELESITIPKNVSFIGFNAFCNCYHLRHVVLPQNHTLIDACAFWNCHELKAVTIPEGVKELKRDVFNNTQIHRFEIPSSLVKMAESSFRTSNLERIDVHENNPKFKSIDGVLFNRKMSRLICFPSKHKSHDFSIPDSVNEISAGAFTGSGITVVTVPSGVKEIKNSTFSSCKDLKEIHLPKEIHSIGDDAFHGCEKLERIHIPKTVNKIGKSAFSGCEVLKAVVLPMGIKEIKSFAFYGCESLKRVIIPNSLEKIGSYAFMFCASLTTILIPPSVKDFGDNAFAGCKNLIRIRVPEKDKRITVIDDVLFNKELTELLLYLGGKRGETYQIPDGVVEIRDDAFTACHYLEKLNLPASLEKVGFDPFEDSMRLREIQVHEDNRNYSSLDGVLFNQDKTTLVYYPCGREPSDYVIPDGVMNIAHNALQGFKGSLTLSMGIKKIDQFQFSGCNGLEKLIIPNVDTMEIEYCAFWNCENLKTVEILAKKDDVTINHEAFPEDTDIIFMSKQL